MTTVLTHHGLVEIPEAFRKADALKPGQRCEIERLGQGEYRLSVKDGETSREADWVDWLLACPEKGWFDEPDRSEKTSLQPSAHFEE